MSVFTKIEKPDISFFRAYMWSREMLAGVTVKDGKSTMTWEGVKISSIVTDLYNVRIGLTNGDSNYTTACGHIYLEDVLYVEILNENYIR